MVQPIIRRIDTELTAYEAFCRFRAEPSIAFLESRPGYGELGRYSILALNPYLNLRCWQDYCLLNGCRLEEDPFQVLERLLVEYRTEPVAGLPLVGGCIGSVAYDAGFSLVGMPLPERARIGADHSRPLASFDFYDNILIFNHENNQVQALACGQLETADSSLNKLLARLEASPGELAAGKASPGAPLASAVPAAASAPAVPLVPAAAARTVDVPAAADYRAKVERIRELIRQGEVYIANLTQQLKTWSSEPAADLYHRLRLLNPAPFAAFVRQGELEILSSSPERLIQIRWEDVMLSGQLDKGRPGTPPRRQIETRPIKGTRPRGHDATEDSLNAQALLDSGKDRSELLMIVDLERNDLSRICRPESVRVPDLFRLETFPTVFHLVATVTGVLRDEISAVDCLRACFPGGSITGAPKVAAMQIIDRLEDDPRYLYTGCLGYFSLDGQADFNILIRSMIKQGQAISYGTGGGITWESDAQSEYEEMLIKAKSFLQVVGMAAKEVKQHDLD